MLPVHSTTNRGAYTCQSPYYQWRCLHTHKALVLLWTAGHVWVQSLNWTTGLANCKQKQNILIPSLTPLPTVSFLEYLEVKGHLHI